MTGLPPWGLVALACGALAGLAIAVITSLDGDDVASRSRGPSEVGTARDPDGVDAHGEGTPQRELAGLRDILLEEIEARELLESEVRELRAELALVTESRASSGRSQPEDSERGEGDRRPWFDEDALRSGGLSASETNELRRQFEQLQMAELNLRDRAVREGWARSGRFSSEWQALGARRTQLREQLGEERYDWFLFASGRANRVVVNDVLQISPAGIAGVESGDLVRRYDGVYVYQAAELQALTRTGEAGSLIPVELERGDRRLRVFVPRGPLGVRLGATRHPPDPVR